ncbi:MAG: sigma 54-interacting transcriptional regulator, partial [Clostridia bacterium]|nr:sigma 54-interacting transcriptional regulator [Clostridia bacterium]
MNEVSAVRGGPECVAVVLHLHPPVINGYAANELGKQIQQLATVAPIVAVFDREIHEEIAESAQPFCRSLLDRRKGVDELVRTLAAVSPLEWELADFYLHRPHTALVGATRCWATFTPSVFPMVEELRVAAAHDVTLLLIGETGAGKTFLARTIHELSPRAGKRFLTVACGALPPDLIESELFGYVKGAFTGADVDKPGKFAAAEDGTLLLDEIDVLAPDQQA